MLLGNGNEFFSFFFFLLLFASFLLLPPFRAYRTRASSCSIAFKFLFCFLVFFSPRTVGSRRQVKAKRLMILRTKDYVFFFGFLGSSDVMVLHTHRYWYNMVRCGFFYFYSSSFFLRFFFFLSLFDRLSHLFSPSAPVCDVLHPSQDVKWSHTANTECERYVYPTRVRLLLEKGRKKKGHRTWKFLNIIIPRDLYTVLYQRFNLIILDYYHSIVNFYVMKY